MSAFLGPIHYWLYNKILMGEHIQMELLDEMEKQIESIGQLKIQAYDKYGEPNLMPLEQVIDEGNIHGWLHQRIGQMEGRLACIVTGSLSQSVVTIEQIAAFYERDGYRRGSEVKDKFKTPGELYRFIFDQLVEGMPCDRVNEVIIDLPEKTVWRTNLCVHAAYWEAEQGDVTHYYKLKDAWVTGVVAAFEGKFIYEKDDQKAVIRRIQK